MLRKLFWLFFCSIQYLYAQKAPDTVRIGCYIINIHDLDFRKEEYVARFWLWTVQKSVIEKASDAIEIPNAKEFHIDNEIHDSLDSRNWYQFKIQATMTQKWNISNFPFDKQTLQILIENPQFDAQSLIFLPDTSGKSFDPNLEVAGWKITNFKVKTRINRYNTTFGDYTAPKNESNYAQFAIVIDIKRDAWGLFFKLFLGMYVAFAISYVSFFIDPSHAEPRFGLPVGGLFAGVGNKYVIDSYLPEGSTLTIVDWLHGLTFIMIFVIIAFSALSLRQDDSGLEKLSNLTDKVLAWLVGGTYVIFNLVFILMALKNV
ncbi:ligand-gated ion channel [Raineya orbicola]|jgi:hypothetical protein|uniref:Neurotransmitter-gated ion-channel ligand binding domain n=1 Tax=Raineya orbicola TaxID=2016530 RepID=A0A2N3IAW9_9BACT|nr:hypothetical protein [Raineya orbicola]PKQ67466.1 hypothetical protein Rain11_2019 [Raineya orbicola]